MTKSTPAVGSRLEQVFLCQFLGSSQERILKLRRGTAPWDSLKHIELINAIEAEFSVRFSFADAIAANSIEEIQNILERLLRP